MTYTDQIALQLLESVILQQDMNPKGTPALPFDSTALTAEEWAQVFGRLREHKVLPLFSDALSRIPGIPADIAATWKKEIYAHTYHTIQLQQAQGRLLGQFAEAGIPVVVLKGTAAARYYASPQYRTMGDIDLLTLPEQYDRACAFFAELGWEETTGDWDKKRDRHRSYQRGDVEVEMHRFFAAQKDAEKAACMDRLLYEQIRPGRSDLPDTENGLVILGHISQHMRNGIGLRQIIDWRMFVSRCLDDDAWERQFRSAAKDSGLDQLAVNVTRMCRKYLGLRTDITWCAAADEEVCDELMQYVMDCGNFGNAQDVAESNAAAGVPSIWHPIKLFGYLQSHGEDNWKALKKHKWLKPFAWLYQIFHMAGIVIRTRITPKKRREALRKKMAKEALFRKLGAPNVVKDEEDDPPQGG